MTFHLNPETGEVGKCRATKTCPFGDLKLDHYSSAEEARAAYEARQSSFSRGVVVTSHRIELDSDTEKLLADLSGEGVTPLVVGGAVRDSLAAGTRPKDVDIEVHGMKDMDHLIGVLKEKGYRVDEVGKSFGVVKTLLPSGLDIDLSLPRKDSRVGAGHRGFEVEVDPDLDLADAAARRDFTINSLYYDHSRGVILDAHGGLRDWEAKRLRHVSEAFSEDPLRVLRAVQFSSRFGLDLAPETVELSRKISDEFKDLPNERVREEWEKVFTKGKDLNHALKTLRATGWDRHFGLDSIDIERAAEDGNEAMRTARDECLPAHVFGPAAISLHLPDDQREAFLRQAITGDRHVNQMMRLSLTEGPYSYDEREMNRWARNEVKAAGSSVREWDALHGARLAPELRNRICEAALAADCWDRPCPDRITGQMILDSIGTKRGGPWVGQIQREAAEAQDQGHFVTQAEAEQWLASRMRGFIIPDGRSR